MIPVRTVEKGAGGTSDTGVPSIGSVSLVGKTLLVTDATDKTDVTGEASVDTPFLVVTLVTAVEITVDGGAAVPLANLCGNAFP
jgi:hypothetical protein